MNKNFYFLHVCLVWALTLTLAGLLLVMGIKTVFTGSRFPSHQLFILFMILSPGMGPDRTPGDGTLQKTLPPYDKSGLLCIVAHGEVRHQGRRGRGPIFLLPTL